MYPSNKLFIKVSKGGNVLYIRLIKREREEESIQINLKKSYLGNTDINRTLKKKLDKKVNKKKLWNIFDQEKVDDEGEKKIECVYSIPKDDNLCHTCNSYLMIMEDGFPTCTNTKCGIIYKDILDYSPEWRYYGADDKNANDPTRCGNPINPLLIQSSFGCKVLCSNNSSYEMKKIRKALEWQSMPHKEENRYMMSFSLLRRWLKMRVFLKSL